MFSPFVIEGVLQPARPGAVAVLAVEEQRRGNRRRGVALIHLGVREGQVQLEIEPGIVAGRVLVGEDHGLVEDLAVDGAEGQRAGLRVGRVVRIALPALVGQADRLLVVVAETVDDLGKAGEGLEVRAGDRLAEAVLVLAGAAEVAVEQHRGLLGEGIGRGDGRHGAVLVGIVHRLETYGGGLARLDEVFRILGLEVDHAADGARPVERRGRRAAQHFDLLVELGIGEERAHAVLLVELHRAVHRDDDLRFVRRAEIADAADVEGLAADTVAADDGDARHLAEQLADGHRLLGVDVLPVEDGHRLRRVDRHLLGAGADNDALQRGRPSGIALRRDVLREGAGNTAKRGKRDTAHQDSSPARCRHFSPLRACQPHLTTPIVLDRSLACACLLVEC